MGIALPIIAALFIVYALYGQYAPGLLVHPGTSWKGLVNHLYLTSQGIYGIAVGVVATYVFHFVLFGVLANRIGAGQLFIDLASCVAGRYAGGPAKVSVFSSALFGMISGSSIANTVSTGALTIPAMKRVGYQSHFAAAVEATASTGGQITPPIMGAAAFIMIEFLELPYGQAPGTAGIATRRAASLHQSDPRRMAGPDSSDSADRHYRFRANTLQGRILGDNRLYWSGISQSSQSAHPHRIV